MTNATNPVKVELTNETGFPRRYTVSNSTGILKNAVLTLSDPRTAATVTDTITAAGLPFAGIASMEKEANDGSTSIAAWTDGVFEVTASGAITIGCPIMSCGGGYFCQALTNSSGAFIAGYAMETASDAERFNARLKA